MQTFLSKNSCFIKKQASSLKLFSKFEHIMAKLFQILASWVDSNPMPWLKFNSGRSRTNRDKDSTQIQTYHFFNAKWFQNNDVISACLKIELASEERSVVQIWWLHPPGCGDVNSQHLLQNQMNEQLDITILSTLWNKKCSCCLYTEIPKKWSNRKVERKKKIGTYKGYCFTTK